MLIISTMIRKIENRKIKIDKYVSNIKRHVINFIKIIGHMKGEVYYF